MYISDKLLLTFFICHFYSWFHVFLVFVVSKPTFCPVTIVKISVAANTGTLNSLIFLLSFISEYKINWSNLVIFSILDLYFCKVYIWTNIWQYQVWKPIISLEKEFTYFE